MTDHDPTGDPTSEQDNIDEFVRNPFEEIAIDLGRIARLHEELGTLTDLRESAGEEARRLEQAASRVRNDQSEFSSHAASVELEHRNAVLETVQRLAYVLSVHDISVEQALELIKGTLDNLDPEVLGNVVTRPSFVGGRQPVPAVNPIDYQGLAGKAEALRALEPGDFVGLWKGRSLYVGKPEGEPRLRLKEATRAQRGTEPFPYTVQLEIELEREEPDQEETSFAGDLIPGTEAIVASAVLDVSRAYRDETGSAEYPHAVIKKYAQDQEFLELMRNDSRLTDRLGNEQKRQLAQARDMSDANFREAISERATDLVHTMQALQSYAAVLGSTYFDERNFRKATDLVDAIYGDGSDKSHIRLAAYTQVLAQKFLENGELAEDVEVSELDLAGATYALMLHRSKQ
jgi:hypothetical protein